MAKDSIDKATDRQIAEIDKELNEMYARAALEIREKSEDFAREFEKKDAKKRKLVEEGKLDKAEYERWRNTQIFQSENYKQLEKNIAAEMANTNQTAIDYVNGELPKTYAHAYNGFGAGIASVAVGYDFALLNNDSLIALSEVEAKKLNVPKDTAWTNKKIRAEVAQGIAQGESTTAIAKRFEKIGVSEGAAAKRLARTMIGGAQNGGKQAAMQRASASGIIMGKQWKAFHDARTRDSHIMLDNEIVAVDDAFSNGCRYPRDPGGAPGEICNCRCTMSGKVMGFRHADGSVTMVDMSVNCTEMPEGVFPPGYTYSRWKQDAQNRITAKQLREEELAAAENPGYGNSLLQMNAKSGIMFRKVSNTGPFVVLEEPMQKKHIKRIIKDMGLNIENVKYKIDRNPELIGTGICGYTSEDGKVIFLYPDAFANREQLVKTIGHEYTHYKQVEAEGIVSSTEELKNREKIAKVTESKYWWEYKRRTGYVKPN